MEIIKSGQKPEIVPNVIDCITVSTYCSPFYAGCTWVALPPCFPTNTGK